jgi:hypothetical protein
MHDTDTPGSGASTTEPQPPDELWGVWRPGVEVWLPQDPSRNYRDNPLSYTKREAAQERADDWNRRMKHDIQVPAIPALLGVSPAVVAQRDRLGEALSRLLAASKDALDIPDVITVIQAAWSKAITVEQGRKAADRYQAILGGLQAAIGRAEDVMEEITPSGREADVS